MLFQIVRRSIRLQSQMQLSICDWMWMGSGRTKLSFSSVAESAGFSHSGVRPVSFHVDFRCEENTNAG